MSVAPTDPRQPENAKSLAADEAPSGVDRSLIRWMLTLTPTERLDVLQGFVDSVKELRGESGEGPRLLDE